MKLEGIHHISAITADGQRNLDFYVGVLGLRLVKKTVNQDQTSVYHLFYADQRGSAGADLTFFEYPGLPRGRAGRGMVHRIIWRLDQEASLDFWEQRLQEAGCDPGRGDDSVIFCDPEGLQHELAVIETPDEPLRGEHPEIPPEHALQGFHAVRAFAEDPQASWELLEQTLDFSPLSDRSFEARGVRRGGLLFYDIPPEARPRQGSGTVHHVAWAAHPEELESWQERLVRARAHPTPIIDRHYFRSVYFREPSGVLFEIASLGPGFTVDEPLEHLGERLSLPPAFEPERSRIEPRLTPLANPWARSAAGL